MNTLKRKKRGVGLGNATLVGAALILFTVSLLCIETTTLRHSRPLECNNQGCLTQYNVTPTAHSITTTYRQRLDVLLNTTCQTTLALAEGGYGALSSSASSLVHVLVRTPLHYLYLRGPALAGWGFWAGKRSADICADITHVPAHTWDTSMAPECAELVNRKFESFYVAVLMVGYAGVAYQAVSAFWFRVMVLSPFLRDMKMALRPRRDYRLRRLAGAAARHTD